MKIGFFIRTLVVLAGFALCLPSGRVTAQELVHFPSLEDNGPGQPATMLDAYLFRAAGEGRHPAIVFLHGCSGLINRRTGTIQPREQEWGATMNRLGYTVLMVDSLTPRQHGEMCSTGGFDLQIYRKRPRDAYGALWYLQSQPFIRGDRIAAIGWSQGGGVVLFSVGTPSLGRPASLPQGDFRAAVAFYPGSCNDNRQPAGWATQIPMMVLTGAEDVWTPAAPCKTFIDGAIGRGSRAEMIVYPGAYHDFDWPNLPRRERPEFRTREGVIPIEATDPAARQDAFARVPAFIARYLSQ